MSSESKKDLIRRIDQLRVQIDAGQTKNHSSKRILIYVKWERSRKPIKRMGVGCEAVTGDIGGRDGAAVECLSESIEPLCPVMLRVLSTLPPETQISDSKNFRRSKAVLLFRIV